MVGTDCGSFISERSHAANHTILLSELFLLPGGGLNNALSRK